MSPESRRLPTSQEALNDGRHNRKQAPAIHKADEPRASDCELQATLPETRKHPAYFRLANVSLQVRRDTFPIPARLLPTRCEHEMPILNDTPVPMIFPPEPTKTPNQHFLLRHKAHRQASRPKNRRTFRRRSVHLHPSSKPHAVSHALPYPPWRQYPPIGASPTGSARLPELSLTLRQNVAPPTFRDQ